MRVRSLFIDTLLACSPALPVFILKVFYYKAVFISALAFNPLFSVLLVSPVCEEIIFRGVLLKYLLERGSGVLKHPATSNVIISLLFAALHYSASANTLSLLVFFPSLILGWHYTRHKKITPLIITHFIYNLAAL